MSSARRRGWSSEDNDALSHKLIITSNRVFGRDAGVTVNHALILPRKYATGKKTQLFQKSASVAKMLIFAPLPQSSS